MTRPRVDASITLGSIINLISLAGLVMVAGIAWGRLVSDGEARDKYITRLDREAAAREIRLRSVENVTSRLDEKLDAVLAGIEGVDRRLQEMERAARLRRN